MKLYHCFVVLALFSLNQEIFAIDEAEISFNLLNYSSVHSKTEFSQDGITTTIEDDSTELITLKPEVEYQIFGDNLWLDLMYSGGKDSQSGGVVAGVPLSPDSYIGIYLSLENTEEEVKTSVAGLASTKSKTKDSTVLLGPQFCYRNKTPSSLIQFDGVVAYVNTKSEEPDENDSSVTNTVKTNSLIMGLKGKYYFPLRENLFGGPAITFQLSLNGKAESEQNGYKVKGDVSANFVDISIFGITYLF